MECRVEKIWSEWKTIKMLGEGSFGKVYEIERNQFGLQERSAVKIIGIPPTKAEKDSLKGDGMTSTNIEQYYESMMHNFVQEIKMMSHLRGNKNIVSYEDYKVVKREEFGWDIYIRMELLTPLSTYMEYMQGSVPDTAVHMFDKTVRVFSERDIIKMAIDICSALEACSARHIIHRDIKPANIFVSRDGDFKLGDFGIAKAIEKNTSGLSKRGTPTYMAPEIYKGEPGGTNSDLYSLGIVIYKLLNNNREPFLPPYPETVFYQHKQQALSRRINGEELPRPKYGSDALWNIVKQACQTNPHLRWHTASAMKRALYSAMNNASKQAIPVPPAQTVASMPNTPQSQSTVHTVQAPTPAAPHKSEPTSPAQPQRAPHPAQPPMPPRTEKAQPQKPQAPTPPAQPQRAPHPAQTPMPPRTEKAPPQKPQAPTSPAQPQHAPHPAQTPMPPRSEKAQPQKPQAPTSPAQPSATEAAPKAKRKVRKLPIILGGVGLAIVQVIIVIILGISINNNSNHYEPQSNSGYNDPYYNTDSTTASTPQLQLTDVQVGDTVSFGAYEQDNNSSNGKEPINWTVMQTDDYGVLLVCDSVLDFQSFHNEPVAVSWENCTLRTWLNSTFLNAAFSTDEQQLILTANISADCSYHGGDSSGNDTTDKVFILAYDDVRLFFADNEERVCVATPYAASRETADTVSENEGTTWWLRTPMSTTNSLWVTEIEPNYEYYNATEPNYALVVTDTGYTDSVEDVSYAAASVEEKIGVRPAIWVSTQ